MLDGSIEHVMFADRYVCSKVLALRTITKLNTILRQEPAAPRRRHFYEFLTDSSLQGFHETQAKLPKEKYILMLVMNITGDEF